MQLALTGDETPFISPAQPAVPDVRAIAVLRGGSMGDLLMTLPALRSLKDRYPGAALTLLAPDASARLLARRGVVDEVLPLPVATGVHEPSGAVENDFATRRFFDQ